MKPQAILCFSTSRKVQVSVTYVQYGEYKSPHEPDLRGFSNVPIPPYLLHLIHRRSCDTHTSFDLIDATTTVQN